MRRWREKNREYWRSRHRLHQFKRRSLQEAADDGTVTKEIVEGLYAETVCHYCGNEIPYEQRTLDHVIPLSGGGLHSASNLVMACFSCNSAKQDRTKEEFLHDICQNNLRFCESSRGQNNNFRSGVPTLSNSRIEHSQDAIQELGIEPCHPGQDNDAAD